MDGQGRNHDVEFSGPERQIARGTRAKIRRRRHRALRVLDLRRRWIDPDDRFGRGPGKDECGERAGATTDVEPSTIRRRIQPRSQVRPALPGGPPS